MRRIQAGSALSAFGLGFTVPFLYIYVAYTRDLGTTAGGLVIGVFALAALIALPFVGRVIDRRGPKPVVVAASVVAAVGAVLFGLSTNIVTVMLSAALLGAGTAVTQPALATMIVWASDAHARTRAFAFQFFLQNIGLGLGGLIGGNIVDKSRASSFTLLFSIEAVMFLVLAAIILSVKLARPAPVAGAAGAKGGGFKVLLQDKAMVKLLVLGFILFFAVYGQFESGLSAYGTEAAGIEPSMFGTALAANTAVIGIAQFVILKYVDRYKRTRVIAAVGLIWAVAWAIAGYAGLGATSQAMATAAFISTYALFGLGEAMLAPTVAPLVVDLAPESMVGQYNSAFALVKQLALALGPAIGGPMGAALHAPYIVTFVLFSLAVTVLAVRLGRMLTPVQNQPAAVATPSRVVAQYKPGEKTEKADKIGTAA
ncbi:MFS transporter [Streptomyces qinzhouensis]|uniref:MFS transporter n=2 Tax=Streptomyces qinzhouensis TaxID=2599401 RepID=A0A5B8JT42_9ACTN|nr:MFS transporter [Streptomyces qinzhouensis]